MIGFLIENMNRMENKKRKGKNRLSFLFLFYDHVGDTG
jgi:hypothetical protein